MSRLNDDLEHLELDYLRHQALSSMTPKKKGSSKRRERDTRQLESDFGIDELLGSEKMPKSRHPGRKRGRTTPEISHEVIKTFSSRPRRPDRYSGSSPHGDRYNPPKFHPSSSGVRGRSGRAPQWSQVGKKHRKRSSSGSSYSSSASRSSFSSSRSTSPSRSHSSSSSSHSSSSRSHSSTSSSYSHSSRSSSRSRSASPPYRGKGRNRSWPLHALPLSYRGHSREKKLKLPHSVLSAPHPPLERTKRPHPPPRSPDGGWYPEPSAFNRRSPHRQPLRPPPLPGPPKRRPRPPPDYFEDDHSYYPHGRHPEYPRGRPHSPPPRGRPHSPPPRGRPHSPPPRGRPHSPPPRGRPLSPPPRGRPLSPPPRGRPHSPPPRGRPHSPPPRGRPHSPPPRNRPRSSPPHSEQRVVRQVRYPPNRPPPPRDYNDKPYRRSPPPPPPPPPLHTRHGYRSDYLQHGGSDHGYPRERTRHPPEHAVAPRGSWREGGERYYRHPKTGDYSSDESHSPRKENSLVKSSVKVVNRIHRSVRSRSASPREERVKRKGTTDLGKVGSEKKVAPKKQMHVPRRKSAEAKGGDAAETIKSSPKIHKSGKDGDGGDSVPTKRIEPSPVKEVSSDTGKATIREENESSKEPGLMDEELDYDENMDELDLYPTGSLDLAGGAEEVWGRRPSKSAATGSGDEDASLEKTGSSVHRKRKRLLTGSESNKHSDVDSNSPSEDSSDQTERVSPHKKHRGSTPDSQASSNSEEGNSSPIRSPIRVSPERKEPRVVHDTSSHDYRKKSGSKLPVKERLYVSKRTIEEKKRRIDYKDESPSKLRPSLANRLGPSPFGRGTRHDDSHYSSRESHRHGGYLYGRPSKGDAIAIAEAYRQKKRQKELNRDNEVRKAKKPTRMLHVDEPDPTTKSMEDSKDCTAKERKKSKTKPL